MTAERTAEAVEKDNAALVASANKAIDDAYDMLRSYGVLSSNHPVGRVRWVHVSRVRANDYNPNSVAGHEMKLLHTSISSDGYTQPVVTVYDPDTDGYVVVDGFHRFTVLSRYADISESTSGYLPIVVLDKPLADRMASTVRHNRARGKHSVAGMGNLVFEMLQAGESEATVCDKLGLEPEELARLRHITGYSKLYKDANYSDHYVTHGQQKIKADYAKAHPDEKVEYF